MGDNGECPTCGKVVVAPKKGIPWHFKLMLAAFAVYMVYRIYWLIEWLPKHI
jgi:hypothetical protein